MVSVLWMTRHRLANCHLSKSEIEKLLIWESENYQLAHCNLIKVKVTIFGDNVLPVRNMKVACHARIYGTFWHTGTL